MASLNTLRTKFGYVLSAVIAFALLAFIFSLKSDMGFSNSDPKVGEINSEDVTYSEYYAEYQDVKARSGMTESTEQEAASLSNAAWQSMIAKKLLAPGFEQLGLSMSEAERMEVINGELPTQTFSSVFTDPSTGYYNVGYIAEFLSQAAINPEAKEAWDQLNEQARNERASAKYVSMVKSGVYVNKLEVAHGVAAANNVYSGKLVSKSYTSIPDSLVSVSPAEIKKHYQDSKRIYKKTPSRSLSYVTFAFDPTEQDIVDIENTALNTSKEFAASDDLKQYVRSNLNGSISNNYMSASQLGEEQAAALVAGKMYGPLNNNNVWTMSRVVSSMVAPDSIGARHIVLSYDQNDLADSLLVALKGGASFADAARTHSLYSQTAQAGGEVGVMPFSSFVGEFIEPMAKAKRGDIVKVTNGSMIQIIEVYRADRPSRHYQVATVEYPVEASQATIGALHSDAGLFSMSAKGSVEAFNAAADASGIVARTAAVTNGERSVRSIDDSREIARWAFGAKEGEISDIFKTDNGYVVAMVTKVDNEEYRPLSEVSSSISSAILREKKYAEAAKALTGASLDEIAQNVESEVKTFENVKFASQYIPGVGVDAKLVGAITLGAVNGLEPIQGSNAAYVVVLDPVTVTDASTEAVERILSQATAADRMSQYVFNAVQDMAAIKDLRGQYF